MASQGTNMEADRVKVHVFKLDVSVTFGRFTTTSQEQTVTHLPINNNTNVLQPNSHEISQRQSVAKTVLASLMPVVCFTSSTQQILNSTL